MKLLVVGCGSIGKRHLANLKTLGEHDLVAVDPVEETRKDVLSRFSVPVYSSLNEGLRTKPHAVLITTPTAFHVEPALQAAEAGCDLFVEKPLSHSMDGLKDLLASVEEHALITMVGCNMRFHPNLRFIYTFLKENRLGRLYSVRAEVGSYLPDWRPGQDYRQNYAATRATGGGVLLDSIHELDYLRWMLGPLESVECYVGHVSTLEIETEDLAVLLLRFSSGVLGTLQMDYLQHSYARNLKIVGEKGVLQWDMKEGTVQFFDNNQKTWRAVDQLPVSYDVNTMYLEEMKVFLEAIRTRQSPMSDFREASDVLSWTLRCRDKGMQVRT